MARKLPDAELPAAKKPGDIGRWKRAAAGSGKSTRPLEQRLARCTGRLAVLTQQVKSERSRRRALERFLRSSKEHYRELFESAHDAIIIFEPGRGTILEANPSAAKLYGFSLQQLIGRSLLNHTADVIAARRKFRALLATGGPRPFKTVHYRKDRSPLILEGTAAVIEHGGRRVIRSLIRNVTSQKSAELAIRDSELRLRAAMDASLDSIAILTCVRNRRGRIVDFRFADVNARLLTLISARRTALIGGLVCQLMPRIRERGMFDHYVEVVETGRPIEETFLMDSPGPMVKWPRPKWMHHQIVRVGDGVLITTRDVTKAKHAEAALQALPQRLFDAQETERRRVARELHDGVNQLLAAARFRLGQVEELRGFPNSPELAVHVSRARVALDHAQDEVRRIAHGLRPRELDDLGLCGALASMLTNFQARMGVRCVFGLPRRFPALVGPVEMALYRIAQEALTNIERHAGAGRVRVRLRATGAHATLSIADDGSGLTRSDRVAMPGLGLMHMKERAELLGGSVTLHNRPRMGAEIVAKIPLRAGKPTPAA